MPYISRDELEARVERELIRQALDDDKDGVEDAGMWDKVYASVEKEIHGALEGRYALPFNAPIPAVVSDAALCLMAHALYIRRGIAGDQNPWTKQAEAIRKKLEAIGKGDLPLTASGNEPAKSGGAVIGETARLYDSEGRLMI
jgi:phage gp36-like protein